MADHAFTCACGAVEMAFDGEPFFAAACHCDDCQAGGRQIEALPGAARVLGAGEGTEYVMVRRDRIRVVRGAERLRPLKLKPSSKARRVVASCCNTAMYLDNAVAHWVSVYRDRLGSRARPIERRVMVKFAPEGTVPEDGLPHDRRFSLAPLGRILGAWVPMLMHPGRPRLRWPPPGATDPSAG